MDCFLGQIQTFAFNYAPKGWSLCKGQLVSLTQNQALFSLLGVTCGGDGRTNFGLPNLQGRGVVGTGHGAGLANYVFGQAYGVEKVTLTTAQLPAHSHNLTSGYGVIQASNNPAGIDVPAAGDVLAALTDINGNGLSQYNGAAPNIPLNAGSATGGGTITPNGSGQAISVMQPITVVNYCIAMAGIYPSRS